MGIVIGWDMFDEQKNGADTYNLRIQVRKDISERWGLWKRLLR